MANREQGEYSVDLGGTTYTLCLDLDAMCEVEDLFSTPQRNVPFHEILEQAQRSSMRHIRAVLWGCFRKHHPDITLAKVSEIAQRSGGILAFVSHLESIVAGVTQAAAPDPEDVAALGAGRSNPPQAQASVNGRGIGARSKGTRRASV